MKFEDDKKRTIILYMLEKIQEKEAGISQLVSENFSINQNTVHTYINELVEEGIIKRIKRGEYELVKTEYSHTLKRSKGEMDSDIAAYNRCLAVHIENYDPNVQAIWSYVFTEMFNNVMDHSESEAVDIRIEQDYLQTGVMMGDDGIGIFRKIKDYFGFSDYDEAIGALFKGKLTTDAENHSGEGIFFSSKMMDRFFIFSENKIFAVNKYDDSMIANIKNFNRKGTCVLMSLSNYSKKEAKEFFDLYSDVDGGFFKTNIPLKNIFEASPVSRSQAKRVSYGLDKFKEVVIDFDGVPWMGQGFAHQLFVVFAKEHPEIKLIPVHMNEDVTKMYQHVMLT